MPVRGTSGKTCVPGTSHRAHPCKHNKKNKTIYYDNAVIKVYDLPIFYLPKLSHPDPSVDRRSGFLPPSFSDSRNLGAGLEIPYFWNLDKDKDFTLKSRLFESEHPLFSGEYRQAFKESDLIINLGFTEGYKNTSNTKKSGNKSHFFSQFVKKFKGKKGSDNEFKLSLQKVSNKKYLKLYRIKNNLINYSRLNSNLIITPHIGGATFESVEKTDLYILNKYFRSKKII